MALSAGLSSCNDVLNETPRGKFTPEYFKTEDGVKGGITAMYANLRNTWGQGYFFNALETGTDEYTYGQSADENFLCLDMTPEVPNIKPENCRADALWGTSFTDINTANGVIENGAEAGISDALAIITRGRDILGIEPMALSICSFTSTYAYRILVECEKVNRSMAPPDLVSLCMSSRPCICMRRPRSGRTTELSISEAVIDGALT